MVSWFVSEAAKSAETYYKYSRSMKKGRAVMSPFSIKKIGDGLFDVRLNQKMFDADSSFLCIEHYSITDDFYDNDDNLNLHYIKRKLYSIIKLSDDKLSFMMEIKQPLLSIFENLPLSVISFVSDLTFLIKNVWKWYEKYGRFIDVPPSPSLPENKFFSRGCESEQQKEAIRVALSHNISYIWGAPGTGKTQIVLADCVLSYSNKNSQVLVLAPTNSAIEQTLRSIIKAMKEQNLPIDSLYRLGTASSSFAAEYGGICERLDRQTMIETLQKELSDLLSKQDKQNCAQSKRRKCENFFNRYESFQSFCNEEQLFKAKIVSLEQSVKDYKSEIKPLNEEIYTHKAAIKKINHRMSTLGFKIKKLFNKDEFIELSQKIEYLSTCIKNTEETIIDLSAGLEVSKSKLNSARESLEKIQSKRYKALSDIQALCLDEFKSFESAKKAKELFTNLQTEFQDSPFSEDLDQRISDKKAQLDAVSSESKKILGKKNIFCATVDYFYSHYQSLADIGFSSSSLSHVFLDEAAYCSMIKAGILFSLKAPVTFFGDHMQLPPICEADASSLRDEASGLFLWSISSLYFPQIFDFDSNIHKLYRSYADMLSPSTENLTIASLPYTYRFGDNLATILDKHIYHNGFSGSKEFDTQIISFNAFRSPSDQRSKENHNEAKVIHDFIKENALTNYAVLTPYKNQRQLLVSTLRNITNPDNILTIHGSQGREWDTIILSVVESGSLFMMDSQSPKGLHILNTAISRAQKRIVVVCNQDYWYSQGNSQLISDLILSAKKKEIPSFSSNK